MSEQPININVGRDISGIVNLGSISGSVTNAINQLPSSNTTDKPGLKELLQQLQLAIENESSIESEDKAEALAQVEILAKLGQNKGDSGLQKNGKTALKIIKGTLAGLSETTKLVQECMQILPAISTLLALI